VRVTVTGRRRNRRVRNLRSARKYWVLAVPALLASWQLAFGGAPAAVSPTLRAAAAQGEDPEAPARVTPERMRRLTAELRQLCARAPARRAAVYVHETETDLTAGVNANRPFTAASLIKLPVMAAAYRLWEEHPERKTRTALAWTEWMITVSDNASTDRLIDLVGGPEVVTQLCANRGWPNLQVRHAILNHRGRGGINRCTAREVTELLVALDRRELVSEEADEEMWQVMRRSRKLKRIPAGIPKLPGVQVGNKTGTLGFVLHDAAIVRTPRTRYAMTVLLSGQRSDAAGDRFCRDLSRHVFNTLHGPAAPAQVAAR
jgi:beta-lactamase class A